MGCVLFIIDLIFIGFVGMHPQGFESKFISMKAINMGINNDLTVTEALDQNIRKLAHQYTNASVTDYYNPILALCQSSGYGKTRACCELAKQSTFRVIHLLCTAETKQGQYQAKEEVTKWVSGLKSGTMDNNIFCAQMISRLVSVARTYDNTVDVRSGLFNDQWVSDKFHSNLAMTSCAEDFGTVNFDDCTT